MAEQGVVIVGAGLAAAHVASTLREAGDKRPITIVGDEGQLPYERPGLSKGVLLGNDEVDSLFVHDKDWYEQNNVVTLLDAGVASIDPDEKTVQLGSGESVKYADLVIATGARPKLLDIPGAELGGVYTLRRIPDCLALKEAFQKGKRLAVIGGGWIGLEVAAAAAQAGMHVTLVLRSAVPLAHRLGPIMGKHFAELHESHGVEIRGNVEVTALEGDGTVTGVRVGDDVIPADAVVLAVGAEPNTALAELAGLPVDNGIVADDQLKVADHIYAVGDVVSGYNSLLGTHLRVEHWDNAIREGDLVGKVLLGEDAHYDWLPYFFTDQFELSMEYVGHHSVDDAVPVRGDERKQEFIAFWVDGGGVVTAGMNVNIWDVNDTLRALVGRKIPVDRLIDKNVELTDL